MKNLTPSEYEECKVFVQYLKLKQASKRVLLYSHIPNETYTTSWNQKIKNKQMGVVPGIPDYLVITRNKIIFVEMKRVKGNKSTPAQDVWINTLNSLGTPAKVCYGADEAIKFVEENT
jgi:hypothetical protein